MNFIAKSIFALFFVFMTSVAVAQNELTPLARNVVIDAGDITLGATLMRPVGAEDALLPAMVIAHGSAPSKREDVAFYTRIALDLGFAVLAYDKRGVGQSTGVYEPFTVEESARVFNDLANDLAFAARWLADQPGIDRSRIGLLGGSQAGWIMPLAAGKGIDVAFIIIGEGAPVTAGEEEVHGRTIRARRGSESAPDITAEDVAEADHALASYDGVHGYDPAAVLKDLNAPTLWMFGLRDYVIPVTASLERLEDLIRSGRGNHEIHVFPFGDHNFSNVSTGERYDLRQVIEPWLESVSAEKSSGHEN